MSKWQTQNTAEWAKVETWMSAMPQQGIVWITCDREGHRAGLLSSFVQRYPAYHHVTVSGAGWHYIIDGSYPEYLTTLFELEGGRLDDGPSMLHVTALESYLDMVGELGNDLQYALGGEATGMAAQLPFVWVIWTGSFCPKEFWRRAPDFLGHALRFHFESKPFRSLRLDLPIQVRSGPVGSRPNPPSHSLRKYINDRLAELGVKGNQRAVLSGLADAYRTLGQSEEEVIHREALLGLIPEEEARHRADQMFWIGNCHWRLGNLERARHFFQWSIDTAGPDISDSHNFAKALLAQVLKELCQDSEADRLLAEVAQSSKSLHETAAYMQATTHFAHKYMELGAFDEGIAALRKGLDALYYDYEYQDLELGLCELARYYLALERTEEAVRSVQRAYNLNRRCGWDPDQLVLTMMAFLLRQLDPRRSEEVRLSLYDCGYRMGLSKVDGSIYRDMRDFDE